MRSIQLAARGTWTKECARLEVRAAAHQWKRIGKEGRSWTRGSREQEQADASTPRGEDAKRIAESDADEEGRHSKTKRFLMQIQRGISSTVNLTCGENHRNFEGCSERRRHPTRWDGQGQGGGERTVGLRHGEEVEAKKGGWHNCRHVVLDFKPRSPSGRSQS